MDAVCRTNPASLRNSAVAESFQPPLFPESASLARIRPEKNEWRYYRLAVWPDLFGRALLVRHWGRIGTEGRRRLDAYADQGAAINALAKLAQRKQRRGYRPR
jgi:predicted DNA-binding WGR domain protein